MASWFIFKRIQIHYSQQFTYKSNLLAKKL